MGRYLFVLLASLGLGYDPAAALTLNRSTIQAKVTVDQRRPTNARFAVRGTAALKATWCQKWLVHRRLRPEAFAGRVDNHLTGLRRYPLHAEVLDSSAAEGFSFVRFSGTRTRV